MSTNAQSHPTLAIQRDVRGGLLSYISAAGRAKPDAVFWRFARREGYGSVEDYVEASGEPDAVRGRMDEAWDRLVGESARAQRGSAQALASVACAPTRGRTWCCWRCRTPTSRSRSRKACGSRARPRR